MAKKHEIIHIEGVDFELMKPVHTGYMGHGRTIYDCYKQPSEAKINIWKEWKHWARTINRYMTDSDYQVLNFPQVETYNTFTFTLSMYVINKVSLVEYELIITPNHCRAYPIYWDKY